MKTFRSHISESELNYALHNNIPLNEVYRVGSEAYFELFRYARNEYNAGLKEFYGIDKFMLEETDIGEFDLYEGNPVPLDCPMYEEEEKVELGKPKRGGPKKFYVFVKDPASGRVNKVTFGDTTGLKAKINDPEARKSFVARHDCENKKDKTKPGYWACRLPYYAKSLGLSGGGSFFW